MSSMRRLLPWPLAAFIAWVFLWYLQYKFTGHPGSVHLFTVLSTWLGVPAIEPYFRVGTGALELAASVLLLIPRTQIFGAAASIGIMSGAIFLHLVTPLGIDPYDDGGQLFIKACLVWLFGWMILWLRREEVEPLVRRFLGRPLLAGY